METIVSGEQMSKTLPAIAGFGWLIVLALWAVSALLERRQPWEGTPQLLFSVGALVLTASGVVMLLVMYSGRAAASHPRLAKVGLGIVGLGVVASLVAWAVPLWATIYGIGMVVLLMGGVLPAASKLLAASFLGSTVAFIALTEIEVGTPNEYGDYPIAGLIAVALATLGPAIVMWLVAHRAAESEATVALASSPS
jgi:hypothetical protein